MDDDPIIDFTETADEAGAGEVARLRAEQAASLTRLRAAFRAIAPGVPEEALVGETAAEVEAAFEAARAALPPPVPAGAPGRHTPSAASPREKIRAGLSRLA
jgi:Xaa-Pro aminopeptidase